MAIAVVGGSGSIGREVVRLLRERGREVLVLGRSSPEHPVNVVTGAGLDAALTGCDTVVDASNAMRGARDAVVTGTRHLLAAEQRAGVGHHIGITIVGCDVVPFGYYRAKTRQDAVVRESPVPHSLVRATQFHTLFGSLFAATARFGVVPLAGGLSQPVDVVEAAEVVADVAEHAPLNADTTVGGPEVRELADLARVWKASVSSRAMPIRVGLPGAKEIKAGALTIANPDTRGTVTFEQWLSRRLT